VSDLEDEDQSKLVVAARKKYCNDNVEIDEGCSVSVGDDPGVWVAAWVWITYKEAGVEHESDEAND